jgi:hypothetical protein
MLARCWQALSCEAWPWPVQVYALGEFSIAAEYRGNSASDMPAIC